MMNEVPATGEAVGRIAIPSRSKSPKGSVPSCKVRLLIGIVVGAKVGILVDAG